MPLVSGASFILLARFSEELLSIKVEKDRFEKRKKIKITDFLVNSTGKEVRCLVSDKNTVLWHPFPTF